MKELNTIEEVVNITGISKSKLESMFQENLMQGLDYIEIEYLSQYKEVIKLEKESKSIYVVLNHTKKDQSEFLIKYTFSDFKARVFINKKKGWVDCEIVGVRYAKYGNLPEKLNAITSNGDEVTRRYKAVYKNCDNCEILEDRYIYLIEK